MQSTAGFSIPAAHGDVVSGERTFRAPSARGQVGTMTATVMKPGQKPVSLTFERK